MRLCGTGKDKLNNIYLQTYLTLEIFTTKDNTISWLFSTHGPLCSCKNRPRKYYRQRYVLSLEVPLYRVSDSANDDTSLLLPKWETVKLDVLDMWCPDDCFCFGENGDISSGPVKISHKKDGHQRRLHRFHVSSASPLTRPLDPLLDISCFWKLS